MTKRKKKPVLKIKPIKQEPVEKLEQETLESLLGPPTPWDDFTRDVLPVIQSALKGN